MPNVIAARRSHLKSLLILAVGIAMAASLAWAPKASHACSCLPPGPPRESLESSAAVFAGKVMSIETKQGVALPGGEDGFLPSHHEVRLQVSRSWKGKASGTVTVTTQEHSASCGYGFETGREYLVYAHDTEDGGLGVSLCSRTAPLENAQDDVAALGQGTAAPSPAPAPEPPVGGSKAETPVKAEAAASVPMNVAIGLVIVAALAVGYAIGTRRRKP